MKILTVCFGGYWDSNCKYSGDVFSKAVIIEDSINLLDLTATIAERCNINTLEYSIKFTHLNPFLDITIPYIIENEADLTSFLSINSSSTVNWKMPLYVTLKKHQNVDDSDERSVMPPIVACPETVDICHLGSYEEQPIEQSDKGVIDEEECQNDIICGTSDFLEVGKLYSSKTELKAAVENLSCTEKFGFRVDRSTKKCYKVKCVDSECPWKLVASLVRDTGYFEVRKFTYKHTCSFSLRISHQHTLSYKSVAEKIKTRFEGVERGPDVFQIQNDVQKECNQKISYWKARKAKEQADNLIRGTPEENYALLASYCHVLKQTNLGTYTNLKLDETSNFKYIFIAFGASIRGFEFLRKVISVDATFLDGKYGGNLMTAVGQDANQQVYPLAFAVVDSENDESWIWFFQQLLILFPPTQDFVVISDGHLCIRNAVSEVYRPAKHVYCARQIKQNLKTKYYSSGLLNLFAKASEAYTKLDFHKYFSEIIKINEDMGRYLMDSGIDKWSRANFEGDRYNLMTTNNSECINPCLKIARSYQLVSLFEFIRDMMTRWFEERRNKAVKYLNQLPENIDNILVKNIAISSRYDIKPQNTSQFEVSGGDFSGIVDLEKKTCSCCVFDIEKYPCTHAMSVIQHMKYKATDFVSPYYTSEAWLKAYEETIYPLPSRNDWIVPDDIKNIECLPPQVRRKCGRPRKSRILSEGEFKKTIKKKRERKNYKCSLCACDGHNKQKCPNRGQSSATLMTAEN